MTEKSNFHVPELIEGTTNGDDDARFRRCACNGMVGGLRLTILCEGIATCGSSGFASSRANSARSRSRMTCICKAAVGSNPQGLSLCYPRVSKARD